MKCYNFQLDKSFIAPPSVSFVASGNELVGGMVRGGFGFTGAGWNAGNCPALMYCWEAGGVPPFITIYNNLYKFLLNLREFI